MYPATFDYRRASSVDEALTELSSRSGEDVRVLAGGHGLLPAMKADELAPDVLVDIGDCDGLRSIEVTDDGEGVDVGALTTHADLVSSDVLADRLPVLAETAAAVGDVQVRNRGTLGGNLVEADPGADLPAVLVATDATVRVRGLDGRSEVPAVDFFEGGGETALADDELVTGVVVEDAGRGAYVRKTHPARGFAMVGVAAVLDVADGAVEYVRVGAVGATDRPVRLPAVEDALEGEAVEVADGVIVDGSAIEAAADRVPDDVDEELMHGDVHASGAFRTQLLGRYVERAVRTAVERACGGASA